MVIVRWWWLLPDLVLETVMVLFQCKEQILMCAQSVLSREPILAHGARQKVME